MRRHVRHDGVGREIDFRLRHGALGGRVPGNLVRLFGNLRGVHRLVLPAAGNRRVVLGVQTDSHLEEFLVGAERLTRDGEEFRVGLDDFQVALRHVLVEQDFERTR